MPPVHPAVVHFPIALTVTSIVAETIGVAAEIPSLLLVGQWTIAIAAAGALLAAGAGYWDMNRDELAHETHEIVHLHMKFGFGLVLALLLTATWRWTIETPSTAYLILGWIIVGGIALQAWFGGEIVYAHGGGVAATGQGTAPENEAKQPSRRLYRLLTGKDGASASHKH